MHNQSQDRIRNLYQMLFEMATGNLSFRLSPSKNNDEIDALGNTLNTIAGAMQLAILESGYVNPHYTFQTLVQSTFVLESDLSIKSFSANLQITLGYSADELLNSSFAKTLADQSIDYWRSIREEAATNKDFHQTVQLIFITKSKKLIPSFCTISRMLNCDKIMINTITTILQNTFADLTGQQNLMPRISDSAIIQNVQDFILNNLDEPLPTVKELSKMFGTNEFKLKDGFRHFFNISVYQFYNEERLKKAHLLIQQTDLPLKAVAIMSGFNDYTNFYKSFKKRFQYSPSDLLRSIDEDKS